MKRITTPNRTRTEFTNPGGPLQATERLTCHIDRLRAVYRFSEF